jgi:hypothetical protein
VVAVLLGMLYALPVMVGMQQPISFLIMAFALWEAWKLNTRPRLAFSGPFRAGGDGGADATATGVYYA